MTEMTNEDVLVAVLDGSNRHDIDGVFEPFADDGVFESPRGPGPDSNWTRVE